MEMTRSKLIMDIIDFDASSEDDIDPIIIVELLELKENEVVMRRIRREG